MHFKLPNMRTLNYKVNWMYRCVPTTHVSSYSATSQTTGGVQPWQRLKPHNEPFLEKSGSAATQAQRTCRGTAVGHISISWCSVKQSDLSAVARFTTAKPVTDNTALWLHLKYNTVFGITYTNLTETDLHYRHREKIFVACPCSVRVKLAVPPGAWAASQSCEAVTVGPSSGNHVGGAGYCDSWKRGRERKKERRK